MSGSLYSSVFGTGTPSAPVPAVSGLSEVAGAATVTVKAATQHAEKTTDATTTIIDIDTRVATDNVATVGIGGCPPTIAAVNGTTYSQEKINTITVTLTGTTGVTALDGLGLYLDVPTVTDASAITVTTLSNLYVALPVAAGSVTATNIFAAHFAGAVKIDGNINVAAQATNFVGKANTAAALALTDGTTSLVAVDTRNTVTGVKAVLFTGTAPTIAGASGTTYSVVGIGAITFTTSTQTGITALQGLCLNIGAPTVNQSGGAVTVTAASVVHIAQLVAGASVTISSQYMISTGVSDCFLTNAGVWTDHSCFADGKRFVMDAATGLIEGVLGSLRPRQWQYTDMHGDDKGRLRAGLLYDELPDVLRAPGQDRAVAPGLLASFALAALKLLYDENRDLRARVLALEAK